MKRLILVLFLFFSLANVFAQKGDLFGGIEGGYTTYYNNALYGLNVGYHIADPLEISFTGLLNTNASRIDYLDDVEKFSLYSFNFDFHYYLLLMRSWGMGPVLGYQFLNEKYNADSFNFNGFNLGWHLRGNLTDNLKLMGGWRYTMFNEKDANNSYFYVGIGYTFSLY
jgi:opacity protein-like surface antigen